MWREIHKSQRLFICGKEGSFASGLVLHHRTCYLDLGRCSSAWLEISDLVLATLIVVVTAQYNHLSVPGKRNKGLAASFKKEA